MNDKNRMIAIAQIASSWTHPKSDSCLTKLIVSKIRLQTTLSWT